LQAFFPNKFPAATSYGALLRVDDHGGNVLEALGVERSGGTRFISANGRLMREQLVDKQVVDGEICLRSSLTEPDMRPMTKDWKLVGRKKK
jgi:hypothetical protein